MEQKGEAKEGLVMGTIYGGACVYTCIINVFTCIIECCV
jgi:hypothetical protein